MLSFSQKVDAHGLTPMVLSANLDRKPLLGVISNIGYFPDPRETV
jgi:hypothetical protein